ncbi:MAG: hypothetical protein HDS85_03010 [Bacteroidales bacterium]|nr:hypothetical protein [Bacteroidales bacterium]
MGLDYAKIKKYEAGVQPRRALYAICGIAYAIPALKHAILYTLQPQAERFATDLLLRI